MDIAYSFNIFSKYLLDIIIIFVVVWLFISYWKNI